jgi:ATP-binding cassette subfamily B protein
MIGGGGGWGGGMRGLAGVGGGRNRFGGSTLRASDIEDDVIGKVYDHAVVTRLFKYMLPHRTKLLLTLLGMIVFQVTNQAIPRFIGWATDSIASGDINGLLFVVVPLFAGNLLLSWGAQWMELLFQMQVGQRILYTFRTEMFAHLMRLSLSFYDKNEVGRIMSRVQNDVQAIQQLMSRGIITLIGDILSLLLVIVFLVQIDLSLTIATFTTAPILVGIILVWQRFARVAFLRVRQAIAAVNANLQENISGVRVIQSLSREDENMRRFDSVNEQNLAANIVSARLSAIILPLVELTMAVSTMIVLLYGGSKVLAGTITVGSLLAFTLYINRFFEPIRQLIQEYSQLQRAMVAGARIFEVLDQVPEVQDVPDAYEMPPVEGHVTFEHVGFHYLEDIPVLEDISLQITAGETVAIVGPTGAGKSSLVALLSRSYDAKSGRILIDGHDLKKVKRTSLAQQMGVVLQDPILFSGTIRDNIRYGRPEASDEEVIAAAQAVGVHDFISHLEHGYDTVVHERGQGMSMGQRQLVCFARAILADPRILILDEATANIDTYSEMLIQRALKELLRGRTSFVIAHRLSTIREADRIVVLEKGRVVEMGKHDDLLAQGGLYASLHQMNFIVVGEDAASEQTPSASGAGRRRS